MYSFKEHLDQTVSPSNDLNSTELPPGGFFLTEDPFSKGRRPLVPHTTGPVLGPPQFLQIDLGRSRGCIPSRSKVFGKSLGTFGV